MDMNKRGHEDGRHSYSSKYPSEMALEGRAAKIPRMGSFDADRRLPLHSIYRNVSSSGDFHGDSHGSVLESKEFISKETREARLENRDSVAEGKDAFDSGLMMESQGSKTEKDARLEMKWDDNKETKHDLKMDQKIEADCFGLTGSPLNWKDIKEYNRGKRYAEATCDGRSNLHISLKEGKELAREEREAERFERERKEILKGRENVKEREPWNGVDKEGVQNQKALRDVSFRSLEHGSPFLEQKKKRDLDNWRSVEREVIDQAPTSEQKKKRDGDYYRILDRECVDRRKEGDAKMEVDKSEKCSMFNDKEPDSGCLDKEEAGSAAKEKEAFNNGIQCRKLVYSKSSPGLPNYELHPRPHHENEGFEGVGSSSKLEVSFVIYKPGECIHDLIKIWEEYKCSKSDKYGQDSINGPTVEIRIPAEHVTASNRQVRSAQIWGTDVYTDDSDIVAVLMHTGYCRPAASPPPAAIEELRAVIRILPPQDAYSSMLRNNVRSRAWGSGIGFSFRVEHCCLVKKGGGILELQPCLTHASAVEPTLAPVTVERSMTTRAAASNALRQQRFVREVTVQYNLCYEPWIKYSISFVADKGLKKAFYTSARLKKGDVLYLETHSARYELCFCGEKMMKASPAQMSQGGYEELEKVQIQPQLVSNGEKNDPDNLVVDMFRWSRCRAPLPEKMMRAVGIPLPLEYVKVLEDGLEWEDVRWSQNGVWVGEKEYVLARGHFLSPN